MTRLIALFILTFSLLASADSSQTWVMRLNGKAFLVLTVDGNEATLLRPKLFGSFNGAFAKISAETVTQKLIVEKQGACLDLREEGNSAPYLRLNPDGRWLSFGADGPPMSLDKVETAPPLNTDWPQTGSLYSELPHLSENSELATLFAEDQHDRQGPSIDWSKVTPRDKARRQRVRELLEQNQLHSGKDFENAAFIFQHGEKPTDYLLAHSLALVAVARGERNSTWIASATLDRYLKSVGQPQIYGTQYFKDPAAGWTQNPMDEGLIDDSLRRALGVPPRDEQLKQLEKYRTNH